MLKCLWSRAGCDGSQTPSELIGLDSQGRRSFRRLHDGPPTLKVALEVCLLVTILTSCYRASSRMQRVSRKRAIGDFSNSSLAPRTDL